MIQALEPIPRFLLIGIGSKSESAAHISFSVMSAKFTLTPVGITQFPYEARMRIAILFEFGAVPV